MSAFMPVGQDRCELGLNGMHRRLACSAGAVRGQTRLLWRRPFPDKIPNNCCTDLGQTRLIKVSSCTNVERVTGIEPACSAWEDRLDHPARSVLVLETGPDVRLRCSVIRADPGSYG